MTPRLRSMLAGLLIGVALLPLRRPGSVVDLLCIGAVVVIIVALFDTFDEDAD